MTRNQIDRLPEIGTALWAESLSAAATICCCAEAKAVAPARGTTFGQVATAWVKL